MKRRRMAWIALLLAGLLALSGCEKIAAQLRTETGSGTRTETRQESPESMSPEAEAPAAPAENPADRGTKDAAEQTGPITDPQGIADYLFAHGKLPENFITKEEAEALGWDSSVNYVSDVAPGKSIGGDRFGNYDGKLPKGKKYFECDCNYRGGKRGAERIVYSDDGRVWYTGDHYETFTELFPSE